ncbi:hypothetical protein PPL_00872 [Heterostelium album PN500]|uniref:Glutathione S-transferase n=1 Tax=Heterostelium pallidum (strain ATCC 26659 / Pp 5 / PN500) TaxID=670386 RepID=D3AYV3_HETP5|nr:hypothetical protein PPL_00872 [Heterostelium album PN500]EFA85643.1 hypothetical protein PPL_00872 [Heterostelium album PN500]|eukprot:XP_020437750.1 hypothetical protein PPL_00872 [Heterostelium album PN500]
MTIPTLIYFNRRGRGEFIRLILKYLKVEYNDVRIEEITDELRSRLPYHQVPLYEDGDVTLVQSIAIARYIANKHNFAGATLAEKAIADSLVDSTSDTIVPFKLATQRNDEEAKNKFKSETLPKFLKAWESALIKNGANYFVGQSYTWADVYIYYTLYFFNINGYTELVN